jgi:hypothetical protein
MGTVPVVAAVTDTVGHVVQAAGIPLTELDGLEHDARRARRSHAWLHDVRRNW